MCLVYTYFPSTQRQKKLIFMFKPFIIFFTEFLIYICAGTLMAFLLNVFCDFFLYEIYFFK